VKALMDTVTGIAPTKSSDKVATVLFVPIGAAVTEKTAMIIS
jgi:hypothetical protein